MVKQLLLVVGSEEIFAKPDTAEWAKAKIRAAVGSMGEKDVVLATIHNPAKSCPSSWASFEASERKVKTVEILPDGSRYHDKDPAGSWVDPAILKGMGMNEIFEEMGRMAIDFTVKARDSGWSVRVLAVSAPLIQNTHAARTALLASLHELTVEDYMFEPPPEARPDVVWLDLETGGTAIGLHPIIEVGAVRTDPSCRRIVSTFETKLAVPLGTMVAPDAAVVNGYSTEGWKGAPSQHEGLSALLAWLPKKFTYAGYNTPFDKRFLVHALERCGLPMPGWGTQDIDPLHRVRSSLKKTGSITSARLDVVCEYMGVFNKITHRALADAERARLVHLNLLGKTPETSIFDKMQSIDIVCER